MSKYQDRAMELRHDPAVHYNCAQVILMGLHDTLGISEEQARDLGALFAGGMYAGAMCGAITGALMALGLAGQKDPAGRELIARFKERHGDQDCAPLLAKAEAQGAVKSDFCNAMICDAMTMVEEALGL